ncbi:hypothetical protein [Salinibacter altiplanensis]|uniref:hypothetical protein n=1 Tax=Salinibacter altiplanensis TaxID=1803181 RepID=UPI0012FFE5D3|nr:hypothetical protein [Salinibacter altiplanensis]
MFRERSAAPVQTYCGCTFSGCSAQDPGTPRDEPETPDRLQREADYSAVHTGDALVVRDEGGMVLKQEQNGYDLSAPHFLASGTKSLARAAALAAVEDGLFLRERPALAPAGRAGRHDLRRRAR